MQLQYRRLDGVVHFLAVHVVALTRQEVQHIRLALFALLLVITEPFWPVGVWGIALAALCVYRHRANIQRLIKGTENKLSFKKKA